MAGETGTAGGGASQDAGRQIRGAEWVGAAGVPPGDVSDTVYSADLDYLRSKVPPKSGPVAAVVGAPVTIGWDRWGLAHIRAGRRRDLFFGLGYATAQECLWRLDYCRRLARGELAAVLGPGAVRSDRAMRLIGIGRHVDQLARTLPEAVAEALEGLAAGINRWIEQAVDARLMPVEFDWLGYVPAPWTPADSLACWKHRWWTLTGRLENLAIGEAARRHLPPELLAAFMATELGEETIVPDPAPGAPGVSGAPRAGASGSVPGSGRAAEGVPGGADDGEGSNNWVVAGKRTTTGYPVLCSDPHNPFGQPGQWFQAQLTLADGSLDAVGAIYAGLPGMYLGRNRHIAWGFTNHVASARDLYVETVDPGRPGLYLEGGAWRPFDVEHARIEIRGQTSEDLEIRRTVRGPVANALLPDLEGPAGGVGDGSTGRSADRGPAAGTGRGRDGEQPPITLRWSGLEVGSGLEALLGLNAAATVEGALDALSGWPCPILNAVVADDRGRIAYHVVGRVPRRAEAARRYRRADDPADAWQGFVDYDKLPQLADPPRGWIASANQPPWRRDPPGLSYLAGGAWADGGRMRRIRRRLTGEGERKYSPAELGAIQADDLSERAVELMPALLRLLRGAPASAGTGASAVPTGSGTAAGAAGAAAADPRESIATAEGVPTQTPTGPTVSPALMQRAAVLLEAWDGRFSLESSAPAVWVAFWDAWQRRVAAARFPAHLVSLTQGQAGAVARALLTGRDTTPPWFAAGRGGDVASEVRAAFAEGVAWVARHFGEAPDGWQWGRHHIVTWRHVLSEQGPEAQRRAAGALFDVGPFPTTGGVGTVRAAGFGLARPFEVTGGATYRLIADLSPGGGLVATATTGQSGHPGSPHYADQARLWLDDAYHPFPMDDFEAEGVTTLTPLRPA